MRPVEAPRARLHRQGVEGGKGAELGRAPRLKLTATVFHGRIVRAEPQPLGRAVPVRGISLPRVNPVRALVLVAIGAASLGAAAADDSSGAAVAAAHWLPRAELAPRHRARLPAWCDGTYVERSHPHALGADLSALPLYGQARRVRHGLGERLLLEGGVVLEQGNRRLTGERATLAELADGTRQVGLTGGFAFSEPGMAVTGATAQLTRGDGRFEDMEFLLFGPGFRGAARAMERSGDLTRLTEPRFTRCEPDASTWQVEAAELTLREGADSAQVRGATLRFKGVPVLYAPRLRLPLSEARHSGFLFPPVAWSRDDGLDVAVPYYFNLHPQYDATVAPRYIANRGSGLEVEARGLTRSAMATVGVAMLMDDDLYRQDTGERDSDRWLATIDHRGRFGALSTDIDYAAASDADYLRDLGTDLALARRPFLTRFAQARYARGGWSAGVSGLGFQWLAPRVTPYRRLPEVDVSYVSGAAGVLNWSLAAVWTAFDAPQDRARAGLPDGRRLHLEPTVSLPFNRSWGFLKLGAGYRYTAYDVDGALGRRGASPERRIAFGDVDAGLFFERGATFGGADFVQTLEPRVYYLRQQFAEQDHLPRFDPSVTAFSFQQLFRRNRFAGLDRISDADQLTVALVSRMLGATSGQERLRASLGTIVHFQDRRVVLGAADPDPAHSTSPVVAELEGRAGHFRASAVLTWDAAAAEEQEIGVALQYRRDNRRIVNIGHRKRRAQRIDQSDVSFIWPLSRRWSAIARFGYDFEIGRANEVFAGFEYANCCWQARVIYRRYVESRTGRLLDEADEARGILLQFVLRGVAGFGSVESNLARGIKGYREESYADR